MFVVLVLVVVVVVVVVFACGGKQLKMKSDYLLNHESWNLENADTREQAAGKAVS
jgi:hypothetical protein